MMVIMMTFYDFYDDYYPVCWHYYGILVLRYNKTKHLINGRSVTRALNNLAGLHWMLYMVECINTELCPSVGCPRTMWVCYIANPHPHPRVQTTGAADPSNAITPILYFSQGSSPRPSQSHTLAEIYACCPQGECDTIGSVHKTPTS